MSKNDPIMYCAVGDYGIEYSSENEHEAKEFIDNEIAGIGYGDEPSDPDYYHIITMTKSELEALPED
jgi:hypothetical protein